MSNDQHKLQIKAFDRYFGLRALLDNIDIWVVPELKDKMVCSTLHLTDDDTHNNSLESRKEEGCYFYFTIVAQHNANNLRSANGLVVY
ncbi:transcriptional regulator SgrR [Proteus mirabilis]|nr:transcriptional regulator SgrR [Proteus mirabilis]